MKKEEQLTVLGEQLSTVSWLVSVTESALGEKSDRWTYEVFDLGGEQRSDIRIELRSPTRDAALTLTATGRRPGGLFTLSDPLVISIRRVPTSSAAGGRTLFGANPSQIKELQRRLAKLIEAQSRPTPAADIASDPAEPSTVVGRKVGRQRRRRARPTAVALLVAALVIAGLIGTATGGLQSLWSAVVTQADSGPSTGPTPAGKPLVIKGKKPKKARACRPAFKAELTPKRSARGNKSTTCRVAEKVRKAYVASSERGRVVKIKNIGRAASKKSGVITCRGTKTVKCSSKAGTLVYLY